MTVFRLSHVLEEPLIPKLVKLITIHPTHPKQVELFTMRTKQFRMIILRKSEQNMESFRDNLDLFSSYESLK